MNIKDRINRICNSSYVIYLEDMLVYEVKFIKVYDDLIFIQTKDNLLFQDLDVLTVEEDMLITMQLFKLIETNDN